MQQALGCINFQSGYIIDFAILAKPLYALSIKKADFQDNELVEKAKEAWKKLKEAAAKVTRLYVPDYSDAARWVLRTDWSQEGGSGYVLLNGKLKADGRYEYLPVSYGSCQNSDAAKRYKTYKGELYAACWALRKVERFIAGRQLLLQTDNDALSQAKHSNEMSSRVG